jgi:heme-degrading monooxygenase HmoA
MSEIETRLSRRALIASGLAGGVAGSVLTTLPAKSQTGSPTMETTVRVDSAVTLVNVFTVEPDNQPKLLALLHDGTETMFSKMPGWISTSLLKSRDGRQVIVHSQWRDAKDIDAFRQDPGMRPYFQQFSALAKFESFTCDVSYSLHA